HGHLRHNEGVVLAKQAVHRTITLRSGAALITPAPGPIDRVPRTPDRGQLVPGTPIQRRLQ
ncbi:MAG: hypothetical protein JW818_03520, partial [Pirellulales bacterium]|nr:hypothetical protein [Pirellulales bacterium]